MRAVYVCRSIFVYGITYVSSDYTPCFSMTLFHSQSIIHTSYYIISGYIRTLSRPSRICSGIAPQRTQLFIAVQSSQDKMTNSCTCPHIWRSSGTFTSVFAVLSGTMTETSTSSVSFASLGAWNKWKGTRIISTSTSHSLAYLDGLKFQVCILQFRCSFFLLDIINFINEHLGKVVSRYVLC